MYMINAVSLSPNERKLIEKFIERSKIFPELQVREIEVEEEYKKVLRFEDGMTYPNMGDDLMSQNKIEMRFYDEERLMDGKMFPWDYFKFLSYDVKTFGLGMWEITRFYGEKTRKVSDHRFSTMNSNPKEEKEIYNYMVVVQEDGTKPHIRVHLEDDKDELRDEWFDRMEEKKEYELVVREYVLEFFRYYTEYEQLHNDFNLQDGIKLSSVQKYLVFTKEFLEEVRFFLKMMYFCYKKVNEFQYFCFNQNINYCLEEIEKGLEIITGKQKTYRLATILGSELEYQVKEFYNEVENKEIHNPYHETNKFIKSFLCPRKTNIKDEKELADLLSNYRKPVNASGYMFIFIDNEEVTLCPSLAELIRTQSFSGMSQQTNDDRQKTQVRDIKEYALKNINTVLSNEKYNPVTRNIRENWEALQ